MKHSSPQGLLNWQRAGFGLYVHWPFCQAKCPYCDFNSHVVAKIDQREWLTAFQSEIRRLSEETKGRVLNSIFFGGGTPSLMHPEIVEGVITAAAGAWSLANRVEITLEANPTSIEAGKFSAFKGAGVTRVSVGVQALNDTDLRKLGRMHSAQEAIRAIEIAQACFNRTSFDLIYARQEQSLAAWESELTTALMLADEHISLYQLTVEDGTVFGDRNKAGHLRGLPSDDLSADMFELTQQMCLDSGRPAYEVSNHAKIGCESRHNMIYWECGDYLGIGPGAHGRITHSDGRRVATVCPKPPGEWLRRVNQRGNGEDPREALSAEQQMDETVLMGMRLKGGIDLAALNDTAGQTLDPKAVAWLCDTGHVVLDNGSLRATTSGILVLNSVIKTLLG